MEKSLLERDTSSARLLKVVLAFRKTTRGLEERNDNAADIFGKVKRIYIEAGSMVVVPRAAKVSELWPKLDKVSDEVEEKDPELESIPGFVSETEMLHEETSELWEVARLGEAIVTVLDDVREEFFVVKKAVAKLLPVTEKAWDARVGAWNKFWSL